MGTAVNRGKGSKERTSTAFVWGPHRGAQLPAPLARCVRIPEGRGILLRGGSGMTPGCIAVCSFLRLLASRHFPGPYACCGLYKAVAYKYHIQLTKHMCWWKKGEHNAQISPKVRAM